MTDQPLVSIGVYSYNNSKYLLETLTSIQNQTYENIELIIVDDCSTDNSVNIIKDWLANCTKPYKFIIHEKNMGVVHTCNTGIKNASGKYYAGFSTDDIMMEDKTRIQVEILENSGEKVGVVYSNAFVINEEGRDMSGKFFDDGPSGNIFLDLLHHSFIIGFMVKMSVIRDIGLYDTNIGYEDYDMALRIAAKYDFVFSDYVSLKYRVRDNGLTKSLTNWNYSYLQIFSKHLNHHPAVLTRIEGIFVSGYLSKQKVTMEYFKRINKKTFKMRLAFLFYRFKIPHLIGKPILSHL